MNLHMTPGKGDVHTLLAGVLKPALQNCLPAEMPSSSVVGSRRRLLGSFLEFPTLHSKDPDKACEPLRPGTKTGRRSQGTWRLKVGESPCSSLLCSVVEDERPCPCYRPGTYVLDDERIASMLIHYCVRIFMMLDVVMRTSSLHAQGPLGKSMLNRTQNSNPAAWVEESNSVGMAFSEIWNGPSTRHKTPEAI